MKKGTAIMVSWVDQGYYTGPVNDADKAGIEMRGLTIGLFIEEDKNWLTVGSEYFIDQDGKKSYRHIMTFPKVCITKIKRL